MKVLWCERHNLQAEDSEHCEDGTEDAPRDDWCIVVPMRLIPDNARWFIEREQGQRVAGPFTTEDDANYARTWVEKVLTPEAFWIRLDGETP